MLTSLTMETTKQAGWSVDLSLTLFLTLTHTRTHTHTHMHPHMYSDTLRKHMLERHTLCSMPSFSEQLSHV